MKLDSPLSGGAATPHPAQHHGAPLVRRCSLPCVYGGFIIPRHGDASPLLCASSSVAPPPRTRVARLQDTAHEAAAFLLQIAWVIAMRAASTRDAKNGRSRVRVVRVPQMLQTG
jgi:hypothetical protein